MLFFQQAQLCDLAQETGKSNILEISYIGLQVLNDINMLGL